MSEIGALGIVLGGRALCSPDSSAAALALPALFALAGTGTTADPDIVFVEREPLAPESFITMAKDTEREEGMYVYVCMEKGEEERMEV